MDIRSPYSLSFQLALTVDGLLWVVDLVLLFFGSWFKADEEILGWTQVPSMTRGAFLLAVNVFGS